METATREVTADQARDAILAGAPDVIQPRGRRITEVKLAGGHVRLVDETPEAFSIRFAAFMDEEHSRGELFHFTSFYSWPVDTGGITKMHIRQEPGWWTLDGCSHVLDIAVQYLSEEPITMTKPDIARATALPFPTHGAGRRGR